MIDKNLIYLTVGKLVQALVAIMSIKVMTSMLPANEVGYQYLILSITLWFSWVLINPFGMFVNRHLHEWYRSGHLEFVLRKMNKYFILVALVSLPIVAFVQGATELKVVYPRGEVILFVCLYVYLSTWFQTGVSFFNLLGLQKDFVTLTLIAQISGLLIAALGIHYWNNAVVWLSGLLVGQIIGLIAIQVYFKRKVKLEKTSGEGPILFSKVTLMYCFPVALSTLFMWFSTQGYRIIVENRLGAEVLASIGVGLGLAANFSGVVESVVSQYLYPKYYDSLANAGRDERKYAWEMLWKRTTIIYVPMLYFSIAISSLLVRVVAAIGFHHVAYITIFGCFIEFLRQSTGITNLAFHGEKRTGFSVLPYFTAGIGLGATVFVLALSNQLNVTNLLYSLIVCAALGYGMSIYLVRRKFSYEVRPLLWLKILLASLPAAIPAFFVDIKTSLFLNFFACTVAGLWSLMTIFYFLRLESPDFRKSAVEEI